MPSRSALFAGWSKFYINPPAWLCPPRRTGSGRPVNWYRSQQYIKSGAVLEKRALGYSAVLLPPAIPAVYLGSVLLTKIDPTWLELLFGLILMVNLPLIFKSPKLDNEANQPNQSKFIVSIIGALTGFVSGLTGAVGLLFNRFYLITD